MLVEGMKEREHESNESMIAPDHTEEDTKRAITFGPCLLTPTHRRSQS